MSEPTVAELREMLENYDDDMVVRIVHQQTYPLQEKLGGIYDPNDPNKEVECGSCEAWTDRERAKRIMKGVDEEDDGVDDDWCCDSPDYPVPEEDEAKVIYMVATGHPYEGSPYGDRRAWEEMEGL